MIKKFSDRLKETRLSNGLHVMVYEIKDRPSFKMDLLVHFGAFYEKYKIDGEIKELKTGLAHFIEHVKFEMPDGDIIPSFEKEGLEVNAYTSFKMTDFYCGGTRNFYRGLELLFKLVFTPCFKEESIEKEREIIQSERLEKDMKKKELSDTFTNNLFISYPYKHEIVGSLEDILSISKEDLEEAYKLFYYPENMDLLITGDVNFEEIIAFLEKEILKYQFNENKNPSLYIEKESLSPYKKEEVITTDLFTYRIKYGAKFDFDLGNYMKTTTAIGFVLESLFTSTTRWTRKMIASRLIPCSISSGYDIGGDIKALSIGSTTEDPKLLLKKIKNRIKYYPACFLSKKRLDRGIKRLLGRNLRPDNVGSFQDMMIGCIKYNYQIDDLITKPSEVTMKDARKFLRVLKHLDFATVIQEPKTKK